MTYRIVGVDERHIVIEFRKDDEEIVFDDYHEAEEYIKHIKSSEVIPSQYKLEIKESESLAT